MRYQDYYATLGVARDADADAIKQAYRRLARRYHPDVSKEPNAESRFKEINEAYSVLSDSDKRRAYDQLGSGFNAGDEFRPPPDWMNGFGAGAGAGGGANDFSELFESLFKRHAGATSARGQRRRPSPKVQDVNATVEITLEEALAGTQRNLHLTGADGMERTLKVSIPPGVVDGRKLRLAGQAQGAPGQTAGDVILEVHLLPHRLFKLQGRDLHLDLPVAVWEAALGAKVEVPTLTGRVGLSIPAGSQGGQRLRLKGRGLPGEPPGDLLVSLQVKLPPIANAPDLARLYAELQTASGFDARADWSGKAGAG